MFWTEVTYKTKSGCIHNWKDPSPCDVDCWKSTKLVQTILLQLSHRLHGVFWTGSSDNRRWIRSGSTGNPHMCHFSSSDISSHTKCRRRMKESRCYRSYPRWSVSEVVQLSRESKGLSSAGGGECIPPAERWAILRRPTSRCAARSGGGWGGDCTPVCLAAGQISFGSSRRPRWSSGILCDGSGCVVCACAWVSVCECLLSPQSHGDGCGKNPWGAHTVPIQSPQCAVNYWKTFWQLLHF